MKRLNKLSYYRGRSFFQGSFKILLSIIICLQFLNVNGKTRIKKTFSLIKTKEIKIIPDRITQTNINNIKAVFIYNFTKYIEWKTNANNEFVILVIGDSPIILALTEIAKTNRVKNMSIVVVHSDNLEEINRSNLVFVPAPENKILSSVLTKIGNRNILVVTESEGSAQKGADINFVFDGNLLKFEININSLRRRGLQTSSQLLKLAISVIE